VFTEPETVEYVVTEVALGDLPTPVRDAFERFDGLPDSTLVELSVEEVDSLPIEGARRVPGAELFGNNKEIADSIFSQYIVAFEAVSVLLLAALIGAIVVARKE